MHAPRRTVAGILVGLASFAGIAQAAPTCTVVADSFVLQTDGNKNFGTRALLQVDATPMQRAFVGIVVSGVGPGQVVTGVALKLRTSTDDKSDSGGRLHAQPGCGWSETGLTWNNQPAFDPTVLDAKGPVGHDQIVEFDPSPAVVTGNGTFCFVLDSLSSDGIDYYSREASSARRPTCVVRVGLLTTTTQSTSTTTSTTTSSTTPASCTPFTCAEVGTACGRIPDGCGGFVDCQPGCKNDGDCSAAQFCQREIGFEFGLCEPKVGYERGCSAHNECLGDCCCLPIVFNPLPTTGICSTPEFCRSANREFGDANITVSSCPGGTCSSDSDCFISTQFCNAQGVCEMKHDEGAVCGRAAECTPASGCCCAHSLLAPAHCETGCGADPDVFGQCIN